MADELKNPLLNSLQQQLYAGTSGAPPTPAKAGDGSGTTQDAAVGWWALCCDANKLGTLKVIVAVTNTQPYAYYSSQLDIASLPPLCNWLAKQVGLKCVPDKPDTPDKSGKSDKSDNSDKTS